jgi:hypothetical protein
MVYYDSALAKSSAGIRTPNRSADALSRSAFFSPVFYDRLYRGDSSRRSLVGSSNSVQSVALLFRTNGGSSPNEPEGTIMSTIYDLSLRLSQPEMEALETLLLNLLESNLSEFTHGNELLAMRLRKALQASSEAITELGGEQ